jgi:PAS domain S-box-containing protein
MGNDDVRRVSAPDRWSHLIEHIQDAVIEFEFVDGDPIIVSVNRAFVDVFGYDRDAVRNESLNELIVPEWLAAEATALDRRTEGGDINYRRVKRETANGLKEFLYRGIPYTDGDARTDGFAVYTDLTDINRYERQSRVLNRVLRHNLRNQINVIVGNANRLLDGLDDTSGESGAVDAINDAVSDLERLSREAVKIQSILDDGHTDESTVDCVPLIRGLVEEYERTNPDVRFAVDLPDSLETRTSERLRFALDSLVDNAIRHNPADEPRVRIGAAASATDGWVDIYVDDDGPEIPETERRVLVDDAEITPLEHGSGLGLWLVKWTVEGFGGELAFEANDMGGNRVRLRLRA